MEELSSVTLTGYTVVDKNCIDGKLMFASHSGARTGRPYILSEERAEQLLNSLKTHYSSKYEGNSKWAVCQIQVTMTFPQKP
jgi:hypothetical protein